MSSTPCARNSAARSTSRTRPRKWWPRATSGCGHPAAGEAGGAGDECFHGWAPFVVQAEIASMTWSRHGSASRKCSASKLSTRRGCLARRRAAGGWWVIGESVAAGLQDEHGHVQMWQTSTQLAAQGVDLHQAASGDALGAAGVAGDPAQDRGVAGKRSSSCGTRNCLLGAKRLARPILSFFT